MYKKILILCSQDKVFLGSATLQNTSPTTLSMYFNFSVLTATAPA